MNTQLTGYLRADGRKGIRNVIVVAYLVECAHHVARAVAAPFGESAVHLIGFGGCYPNAYADRMMKALCTHPNVGGVLLVSLGCESFDRASVEATVAASGRPVKTLVIQSEGGTRTTIDAGRKWIAETADGTVYDPTGSHRRAMAPWRPAAGVTACTGRPWPNSATARVL